MLVAAACSAQSADIDAAVARFQRYYNAHQPDSMYAMFSPRVQGIMPEQKTREIFKQMYTSLGSLDKYEFTKQNGQIGLYKSVFAERTLMLMMSVDADHKVETFRFVPYQEDSTRSNFIFKSPTGSIYGTLVTPSGSGKVPVVLIIAGSGPTDRNCNQAGMSTNAYKQLADSLSMWGIATVRYDKRGVGESIAAIGKGEESIRFDDMIDDAAGFIKMLKSDSRFSKIIVLGHSEGSLIGMVAGQREHAAGFISLAGAGERADYLIVKQYTAQSPELGKKARIEFDSLLKGHTVTPTDPALAAIFRPSVQPYLRSWLKYDPATEINKLKQPVLILQGTTDIQVSTADAQKLKKADKKAQLVLIEGMNHVLKTAPEDKMQNVATYTDPGLPLAPGLVPAIATFVKQQ